ncbi:hypothetical protein SAMN02910456_01858 [Ruminococcaceae bacterium YRB3002]|nr:hypothetical protein SAMN02910456_01858 [Ruminococcaceae bacterium YRB3002]
MIAYVYHVIFIILGFILMEDHPFVMMGIAAGAGLIYWIYWIAVSRRSYMPWIIFLHFVIGTAVEAVLNWFSIIPNDGGELPGAGQFLYIALIVLQTVALMAINGAMNIIYVCIRQKKDTP